MALMHSLDKLPMRKLIIVIIGCTILTPLCISEEIPLFLKPFYKSRKSSPVKKSLTEPQKPAKKPFDPFAYSFLQVKNHLVSREESNFRLIGRMKSSEIAHFLGWWEQKYLLVSSDLEAIYAANHSENQKYPGKFWQGLSTRAKNRLRYQWFKVNNEVLLPEFKLYLQTLKGRGSTFIHNTDY